MPETFFDMVRVGIGMYGLWPSKETQLSAYMQGADAPPTGGAFSRRQHVREGLLERRPAGRAPQGIELNR